MVNWGEGCAYCMFTVRLWKKNNSSYFHVELFCYEQRVAFFSFKHGLIFIFDQFLLVNVIPSNSSFNLFQGFTSSVTIDLAQILVSKLTLHTSLCIVDPYRAAGFPLNVVALLPYLIQHFDQPDKMAIEITYNIGRVRTRISYSMCLFLLVLWFMCCS